MSSTSARIENTARAAKVTHDETLPLDRYPDGGPGIIDDDAAGVQGGSVRNGNGENDAMDSVSISEPKAESDSDTSGAEDDTSETTVGRRACSFSIATAGGPGPLSINQWRRRAPVIPDVFSGAPGPEVATEVVSRSGRPHFPTSINSRGTVSHISGATQTPDSEGHARPQSAYFVYQESPGRVFECEDPSTVTRARGKLTIERCYATENNLSVTRKVQERFENETALESRFSSPAPSCQMPPPSVRYREQTPLSEKGGSSAQNRGPTPEPTFDYVHWKWKTGEDKHLVDNSSFSSGNTLVGDTECATGRTDSDTVTYDKLFGREGSPLTELPEETDMQTEGTRDKPLP